jgi:hypothetical protein
MTYKNYEFFYVNGSSHTKGGGFEATGWFRDQLVKYYKEHYNIEWNTDDDVNWGTRLSELIGIPCHNHALQGGGLDRVIRKTYEFIESNWEARHKFFIILETPDPSRVDLYYNPWQQHFIMNVGDQGFIYATPNYFPEPPGVKDLQDDFKFYYEKFFNMSALFKANERNLAGLYSFCKRENIAIKIMDGHRAVHYKPNYEKSDIISYEDNSMNLIDWCMQNKCQIKHETNFEVIDGHPGYFAHIEYAKLVKEWLDINL